MSFLTRTFLHMVDLCFFLNGKGRLKMRRFLFLLVKPALINSCTLSMHKVTDRPDVSGIRLDVSRAGLEIPEAV